MTRMRMLAMAGLACLALAGPTMMLSGCGAVQAVGDAVTGAPSPATQTAVGGLENAFTVAVNTETVWLKSGKATAAQAAVAKTFREAVYADVVAARTAVANHDSPAVAVAINLFNQALPAFTGYIASHGGGN